MSENGKNPTRDLSGRFVDAEGLTLVLIDAVRDARERRLNAAARDKYLRQKAAEFVADAPAAAIPDLVGITEAAEILDTAKPRIYRYREQGRMPEPVAILSSGPIFVRGEVQDFAVLLRQEREGRVRARAEREAEAARKAAEKAKA